MMTISLPDGQQLIDSFDWLELPEQERRVIRLKYGIDEEAVSLQEISGELGVTGREIVEIERRVLRRLRHRA